MKDCSKNISQRYLTLYNVNPPVVASWFPSVQLRQVRTTTANYLNNLIFNQILIVFSSKT